MDDDLVKGVPRAVHSNQDGIHDDLVAVVEKYQRSEFLKPVAQHTQDAFDAIAQEVQQHVEQQKQPLILDSCCGVGESTKVIAERFPEALVIGIDKSAARLAKNQAHRSQSTPDNMRLVQADLNDFWRLALNAGWRPERHFILYPNPWPKKKHLQRRWHGSPVFPALVSLGGQIELRSNWLIYLQEFQQALKVFGVSSEIHEIPQKSSPITPFERKYQSTGQRLWQLQTVD